MIEIPSALVERIKARQAILVAGLGCSRLAGLPGWDELGERLMAWLDSPEGEAEARANLRTLLTTGRRSAALAYLRSKLSDEVIAEVLGDAYPSNQNVPAPLALVGRIPWRGVVTTAFDDLWDGVLLGDAENPTRAFLPRDAEALEQHRGRFLLHLCGSVAAPDSLCLSPADLRSRLTPTGVIECLDDLYQKRSFVFLGFEPGDPDLKMVSERLLGANVNHVEHFFLYGGKPGFEDQLLRLELGLTPVPLDGGLEAIMSALGETWAGVAGESRPPESDVEAWMDLWTRDPSDDEPLAVLQRTEDKLRADKEWDRLVDLLLGRVERLTDRREQVAVLREVGRIFENELEAPDRAFTALSTAFGLDHDSAGLLADVLRVAGKSNQWSELAGEYAEIVGGLTDPSERARHGLEIARIYAEELNQYDRAIAEYRQVIATEVKNGPAHAAALAALRALLAQQEQWAELVPVLATAAERESSPAREADLRLQMAELQATRLGDLDAAIASYQRIAELDPTGAEALEALERLYRKKERWPELAALLEQKSKRTHDPQEGAKIRKERAELLERMGDVDASIAALEAVVAGDSSSRAALRSLEKLYDKQGRDQDYLRTLERLSEIAEDGGERLRLLRRLAAEWEERPEGLDKAAEAMEQILQIDPRDDDTFRGLGRVYRQSRRWLALVEALNRKIEITDEPAAKRELQAALGKVFDEETREPQRAIDAYAAALALGDAREPTLEALARLDEQQGHWRPAADALDRWAEVAKDPVVRAAALFRAGVLFAGKLDDKSAAEDRYARALEIAPGHAGALEALGALYRAQGNYLRATKLLQEAADQTQNRIQKVRLLYDAGSLYEDELYDEARASEILAKVMVLDPEHVPAGERLVQLYTSRGQWAELEPVLDMLVRKVDKANTGAVADLHSRLGFAAQKRGNSDKALRNFEAAYQAAPTSMPVLAGLADLRLERREWAEAATLYRALLDHHQKALPDDELLDVYLRLAQAAVGRGDKETAITWYEKASAQGGSLHRPALEGLAALHTEKGDFAALVLDKRALMGVADEETKVRLSEEMGDIYLDKLRNPSQAIAAYQAVLALQPDRRTTLHKILELYTAGKLWPQAAGTLVHLADLDTVPEVRARYAYTAAVIRRDELFDPEGALVLFNRALDDSPEIIRAFDAIERTLIDAGDWKELARNYRKMIKRLPAEGLTELRLRLWTALGEVSLNRLDDREMATTAFEVVSTLEPGNMQRHELLADLYVQAGPDRIDKAIGEHQLLLAKNPDRLASYRALATLYRAAGATDKLWCVAATLTFLRKADADLQRFHEQHRRAELRHAKRKFTDEIWEKVIHPDEDPFVAAVFMLLGHFIAATVAQQHQAVGLRRKDRADLADDQRLPARVLRYVSQTLELPAPDVFFKDAEPQGLSMLNLQEKGVLTPAFVIGQGITQRTSEPEMVFEIGKQMAFLRPERFLCQAVSSPGALDIALRSALALGGAGIGPGGHNGEVDQLTDQLRRMVPRPVTEQMAVVAKKLVSEHGEVINVQDWVAAADLSAARVGFVLSNELPAAARVISAESSGQSPFGAKRRLKDLLSYSVSEDYFAVRKFLGLEVM